MGNVFRVINCDGDIEITMYRKANAVFKTNEYNETDNICTYKETINIFNLLQENYELKSQLKGTTHCFDEEEHEKLKKQLEELKEEKQEWINLLDMFKNQQKEFIKYLENETKRINPEILDDGELNLRLDDIKYTQYLTYKEILQKYKEIIGDDK